MQRSCVLQCLMRCGHRGAISPAGQGTKTNVIVAKPPLHGLPIAAEAPVAAAPASEASVAAEALPAAEAPVAAEVPEVEVVVEESASVGE